MSTSQFPYFAFVGSTRIARGQLAEVALQTKACLESGELERVVVFEDWTGRVIDLHYSGTKEEVVDRIHRLYGVPQALDSSPKDEETEVPEVPSPRKRGRPKLGVVSREVSLLPRHWEWLKSQRGGASASLRRLVESARKEDAIAAKVRQAINAGYAFMSDIAGDRPNFEEASRSLFGKDFETLKSLIGEWPEDIQAQMMVYIERARGAEEG